MASLEAAIELLSHARIELICWNGTKGAGLGFTPDRDFCDAVNQRTGLPMVSTALATLEGLEKLRVKRFAMLNPLPQADVDAMAAKFAERGFEPAGAAGMGITDNFAFSEVSPDTISEKARALYADGKPDAILIFNTNMRGLACCAPLEAELGIPVIDSAATGVWAALRAMNVDTSRAAPLGRLFSEA